MVYRTLSSLCILVSIFKRVFSYLYKLLSCYVRRLILDKRQLFLDMNFSVQLLVLERISIELLSGIIKFLDKITQFRIIKLIIDQYSADILNSLT